MIPSTSFSQEVKRDADNNYVLTKQGFESLWKDYQRLLEREIVYSEFLEHSEGQSKILSDSIQSLQKLINKQQDLNDSLIDQNLDSYTTFDMVMMGASGVAVGALVTIVTLFLISISN